MNTDLFEWVKRWYHGVTTLLKIQIDESTQDHGLGSNRALARALGKHSTAGTHVAVLAPSNIPDRRKEYDADQNDARPVHRIRRGWVDRGEAEEHAKDKHVDHGDDVDKPADGRRESIRTSNLDVTAVEHEGANDHGVACKEEDGESREEGVESGDAAEIDDTNAARNKCAEDERLNGTCKPDDILEKVFGRRRPPSRAKAQATRLATVTEVTAP